MVLPPQHQHAGDQCAGDPGRPAGDGRQRHPRFQPGNLEQNLRLLEPIEALAREKGATAAQVALAWVMSKGTDIVPIPGTKRRAYLEENVRAASLRLTAAEAARLDAALPAGAAAGTRYPDMSSVNR